MPQIIQTAATNGARLVRDQSGRALVELPKAVLGPIMKERLTYFAQHGRRSATRAATTSSTARTADGKPWWGVTPERRRWLKDHGQWDAYVKKHPHLAFYDTGVSP